MFGWSVILPLFFGNGLKSFEGGNSKQSNGMMLSFDVGQVGLQRDREWENMTHRDVDFGITGTTETAGRSQKNLYLVQGAY
uniref:Porin n=1 Tax=Bursaphelenchus xylophilus TaxID=6326 RepID=A0A1I7SKC6_BURXY